MKISPWATFQGMEVNQDSTRSVTILSYLLHKLQNRADNGNELAYVSIVELRRWGELILKGLNRPLQYFHWMKLEGCYFKEW